ncbi:hypothetical protein F5883DRAFT_561887 [Diaporthe sp. PMI_573]|nr:hypothetical protein F5883DRAFT_561887 [Diaporthaceae sp. PMI_573]
MFRLSIHGSLNFLYALLIFSRHVLSAIIYSTNTQNVKKRVCDMTQSPSILPSRPPLNLASLEPKVRPSPGRLRPGTTQHAGRSPRPPV